MTSHAFVFARGGSKGLPRKNIKLLAGKPLIQYSIEIAQKVAELDRIFVSTENQEIAEIAERAGAIIIARPEELAQDSSPEWLAWRHAIAEVTKNYGKFEGFVSLPATSPLRKPTDVEAAIAKRKQTGADICIAVTPSNRSPFFNMVKYTTDGDVELVNKLESTVARRQDCPKTFDITTVVYAASVDYIMKCSALFEGRVTSIEVGKERAVDIDDIYDFMLAEAIIDSEG